MLSSLRLLTLSVAVAASAVVAQALTVLPTGATWEYTFTNPTANASWNTSLGGWQTGPAPFGNVSGAGYNGNTDFNYATYWGPDGRDGDDLWVRIGVNLAGVDLTTVQWFLGVDNGYKLFVNGTQISSGNAEGYTSRWEYSGLVNSALLNSGSNVIAVALEDHGGLTAFDMTMTARAKVPDAASTLSLIGAALLGLVAFRRRG